MVILLPWVPSPSMKSFDSHLTSLLLGEPDVHKLSPGCCWKPGLQEPVLRHYPWRGQGAGINQPMTSLKSPFNHMPSETLQPIINTCCLLSPTALTIKVSEESCVHCLCMSWFMWHWRDTPHLLAAVFIRKTNICLHTATLFQVLSFYMFWYMATGWP